jgi:Ca-activated chloride channel family protein
VTQATKRFVQQKINGIRAKGMTALVGGVSKGIAEVKKYISNTRINRVILLSDGQANIGPNSPNALARLGIASARQGISISTVGLGLGYNEDLMTKLANKSDGNHGYAKNASDLARIFQNEMGNLLSVVAQHIDIKMTFAPGIKPIRVLDSQLKPVGQTLRIKWNQLYAKQNKFVIVEVEIPKGERTSLATIAQMHVTYRSTSGIQHAKQSVSIQRTNKEALCQHSKNRSLLIEVAEAKGNETMRKAMKLRDKGKYLQAKKLFVKNSIYLKRLAKRFKSNKLNRFSIENSANSNALRGYKWRGARKRIRSSLYKRQSKQTW